MIKTTSALRHHPQLNLKNFGSKPSMISHKQQHSLRRTVLILLPRRALKYASIEDVFRTKKDDFNDVTEDVQLSFIEIYDRGPMVATDKPAIGRDGSGNKPPLVTGGEYYLTIEQNGKQLRS